MKTITILDISIPHGLLPPLGLGILEQKILIEDIHRALFQHHATGVGLDTGAIRHFKNILSRNRLWCLTMEIDRHGNCLILTIT
jgi:hypothetical protein